MVFQSQKMGKYLLLDRIAVGGMAEVFRGKIIGEQGFEKPVVIKKMLPHLAVDPAMMEQFVDEAKLAAHFQHENIVHIYDFGESDGDYFIAMEYLAGKDLELVFNRLIQTGQKMPLGHILRITAKICKGLEYAHNLKDLSGKPLNFIHRDISPRNIFITYEGKIKILDFGIAKTESQTGQTQVGTIKGKVAYMSPEQAASQTIDQRSDLYAVGILLYEMVTGERMYNGDTYQMLSKVATADFVAAEKIAPNQPEQIYDILNRALAKQPGQRYQTCRQMRDDIKTLLHSQPLQSSADDLAKFMLALFATEYAKDQQVVRQVLNAPLNHSDSVSTTLNSEMETVTIDKPLVHAQPDQKTDNYMSERKGELTAIPKTNSLLSIIIFLICCAAGIWFWYEPEPSRQDDVSFKQEKTTELLSKARNSLKKDRLTIPRRNSAMHYYQQVLKENPENPEAKAGLNKIADRYAQLAKKELDRSNFDQANRYIQKGLSINPNHSILLKLERESKRSPIERMFQSIKNFFVKSPE